MLTAEERGTRTTDDNSQTGESGRSGLSMSRTNLLVELRTTLFQCSTVSLFDCFEDTQELRLMVPIIVTCEFVTFLYLPQSFIVFVSLGSVWC